MKGIVKKIACIAAVSALVVPTAASVSAADTVDLPAAPGVEIIASAVEHGIGGAEPDEVPAEALGEQAEAPHQDNRDEDVEAEGDPDNREDDDEGDSDADGDDAEDESTGRDDTASGDRGGSSGRSGYDYAALPKIGGINPERWIDGQLVMGEAAYNSAGRSVDLLGFSSSGGGELRIYLDADMFADQSGNPLGGSTQGLRLEDIRGGRVTLLVKKQRNAGMFEGISIAYDSERKTSYIKVAFIDPYTGTGKRSVAAAIQLKVDGVPFAETEFLIEGNLVNSGVDVDAGTEYIRLESTEFATAQDDIPGVTVELAGGVSVTTNMYKGKKYYGSVTVADGVPADNAEVVAVYRLTHSNLDGATSVLRFLGLEQEYYVYDAKGMYLGATGEQFAVARAYYLTEEQVEALELEGRDDEDESGGAGSGRGGSSRRGS